MGASRDFAGTGEIDFGTASTFAGTSEITMMVWINTDNNTANQSWCAKWTATQKALFLLIDTSKINVAIGDGNDAQIRAYLSTANASTHISTGTWTHIAGTDSMLTTSGNSLFVDGSAIATTIGLSNISETSIQSNTAPYQIGALNSSIYRYNGRLCHSIIYDERLSQEAIRECMYQPFAFPFKSYIPCYGADSPELEFGNGLTGTVNGAIENFDGPPIFLLGGQ